MLPPLKKGAVMLRFSANLGFLWRELPILEQLRRAKASGFDAVEFHYPYDTPAETVAAAAAELGLPVVGLNTQPGDMSAGELGLCALPGREADARAAIDEAIAYAGAVGAGYVHVMAGKPREGRSGSRTAFLSSLEHASGAAETAGLTVVIEPLNGRDVPGYFLRTTAEAADIIAELGRPNVKILFDCYHVQISEGDLTRRFERLLPLIGHVQIAAVPSRAEPDEGEVAYDRLLPALEPLGWSGYVGAEYRARTSVEQGLGWLDAFRAPARR
jgi:2-dehydrotetronate isomerase